MSETVKGNMFFIPHSLIQSCMTLYVIVRLNPEKYIYLLFVAELVHKHHHRLEPVSDAESLHI